MTSLAQLPENDAVIVDAVRTVSGRGKPGGLLHGVHPVDLHAHAIRALLVRTGIDPALVDDVIGGAVSQVGEQGANTTRWAALAAGLPQAVPATTVDRQCGSSQQAIQFAAQAIRSGDQDLVIASGVESMSRVPIGSPTSGADPYGLGVARAFPDGLIPQGVSAELVAERWDLSRLALDGFAARSQSSASSAWSHGWFDDEVSSPLEPGRAGERRMDQTVRSGTSQEGLAALPPAFRSDELAARFPHLDWRVTAGNSSPLSDGAAAVLLASAGAARRLGLTARARIHSQVVVGDDPILMLTGVVPATMRVLDRAGLSITEIDAFEVNEAFASVVLAWLSETGAAPERVNIHGGAIALGHPLGASGARLMTTLLSVLERTGGRYGLQTMCEAGGMANATIVELLD